MKTFEIEIPKGHEIDKENSTFEKIVFKEVNGRAMSWGDLRGVPGFCINEDSEIYKVAYLPFYDKSDKNIFPTRQDAESSLALAQLLQLRKNWIGDWVAYWNSSSQIKYTVFRDDNTIVNGRNKMFYEELSFPSKEIAKEFLAAHKELIEVYFKI